MNRIDIPCTDPRPDRREALALLAGGDLPPVEAARLEAHAELCAGCRELLAGLRQSAAALALLAEDELAADGQALARVREGVRAGVAEIEAEREERQSLGAPPRWALAAVLLVALVAAAVWLRSGPPSDPFSDPGVDPGSDRPAEQAAERAPDPAAEAPVAAPPATAGEGPEAPDAGPPPADRVARAAPADRPVPPSAGAPEAPDASLGETDPADPGAAAGMSDEARPAGPGAEQGAEPQITIRVVSDDPDIVFYWLVEPEENRDEETVSS